MLCFDEFFFLAGRPNRGKLCSNACRARLVVELQPNISQGTLTCADGGVRAGLQCDLFLSVFQCFGYVAYSSVRIG